MRKAETIRYQNDRQMFDTLLKNEDVVKVNRAIAKMEEGGPMGTRRRLLGTSVRLSRGMAPDVYKMADADGEISENEIEVFEKFFGKEEFDKNLNIKRLKSQLLDRMEKMKAITSTTYAGFA